MTIDEAYERVSEIRHCGVQETEAELEYTFFVDVLQAIARGCEEPRKLAAIAVGDSTYAIDLQRKVT